MQKSLRSLLLCGILLCSLLPLSVFAAGSEKLEDIATITKVEWYEGTTPTTGTKVTGKDYLIKTPGQMLLYYEFDIAEDVAILADTSYKVSIPKGLKVTGTHFYFGCEFVKAEASPVAGVVNRYQIELTSSTTVTVGLEDEEIRE